MINDVEPLASRVQSIGDCEREEPPSLTETSRRWVSSTRGRTSLLKLHRRPKLLPLKEEDF